MLDNTLKRLSIALFLASLALPGLHFSKEDPVFGFNLLLMGWLGIMTLDFPWFANILYVSSLLSIRRRKFTKAYWLCVLCIPTALLSYVADKWYFHEGWGTPITGLGMAFYVWISSFIVLSIELWGSQSRKKNLPGTSKINKPQELSKADFEKDVAPFQEITNRID